MTTASYTYYYQVTGGTTPDANTTYGSATGSGPHTLTDDADGNPNGVTSFGDQLSASNGAGGSFVTSFFGFTGNGEPIVVESFMGQPFAFYVYSDTLYAPTDTIGTPDFSSSFTYCFAAGTMIAGAHAPIAVETLEIGDLIQTAEGQVVAVKWVGVQTLRKLFTSPEMQLVRIQAGALGGGLPDADLTVTADHGIALDGLMINASALVNGQSIQFVPTDALPDQVKVYHVETQNHDVILANGTPSETFVDAASRRAFDNFQDYLDRFGVERIIPELPYPRVTSARLLPEPVRKRLASKKVA